MLRQSSIIFFIWLVCNNVWKFIFYFRFLHWYTVIKPFPNKQEMILYILEYQTHIEHSVHSLYQLREFRWLVSACNDPLLGHSQIAYLLLQNLERSFDPKEHENNSSILVLAKRFISGWHRCDSWQLTTYWPTHHPNSNKQPNKIWMVHIILNHIHRFLFILTLLYLKRSYQKAWTITSDVNRQQGA